MLRRETVMVAIDALRANKLRAFLTMLGVVIGSACIVLVVTVSLTGRQFIIGQIEGVGSNIIDAAAVHAPGKSTPLSYEISLADMEEIRNSIPSVVEVAGTRSADATVVVDGVEHPVSLVGVTQGYQSIRHLVMLNGRYFDPDDMATHNKVCLITQDLAKRVFGTRNPVGQFIHVGELSFTVIAVFRERVETFGLSGNSDQFRRDSISADVVLHRRGLCQHPVCFHVYLGFGCACNKPRETTAYRTSSGRLGFYRAESERDTWAGQGNLHRPYLHARNYRGHRARHQWNRHHEYHAGYSY